jgi:translocation and assembly module TamB
MAEAPPSRLSGMASGRGVARVLSFVVLGVLLLAILAYGGVRWLDTENGRAFIVRQLPGYKLQSGMTVEAGRIDGSIFGKAVIHDIRIGDPKGVFAEIPLLSIDWRPLDLIQKRLTAKYLLAPVVRVLRRPQLLPTQDDRILPDFDFDIDRLKIDRLVLEAPVAGNRHVLGVGGSADIRAGRALVDLVALTLADGSLKGSGDAIRLKLDAEPDRDRFDMAALVTAPAGGAITGLLGIAQPIDIRLDGDGSWKTWKGRLAATLAGTPLADLAISARAGDFGMHGTAAPARLLSGLTARLLGPQLRIDATALVRDGNTGIIAALASRALVLNARGGVNFGDESIRNLALDARLLDPSVLHRQVRGRDVRLVAQVVGTFAAPLVDYRLTAATASFGSRVASDIRAAGIVRGGDVPFTIPVSLTARRLTGTGDYGDPLLTGIRIDGPLVIANGRLVGNGLRFRSDRLSGTANAVVSFANADYVVTAKAALPRYAIPGLGITDIDADVRVTPAGDAARVIGRTAIKVTRLDNGFFASIADGLPAITADFDVAPDLSLVFRNARITAPGISLTASGSRTPFGIITASGSGTSRDYGPLSLQLAGPIDAPVVDVILARPGLGIGLVRVAAHVAPAPGGWRFTALGGSDYGAVTGMGLINTATEPVAIEISSASIAGINGQGRIVQTAAGPFAGRIGFAGPGFTGAAQLSAAGAVQRAEINATAQNAQLALATPVSIDSGSLALVALIPDRKQGGSPGVTGDFDFTGIERDGLRIDNAKGSIRYADGRGSASGSARGTTTLPFSLVASADFDPDSITITGNGTLDRKAVTLSGPIRLARNDDRWELAPVSIVTTEGRAEVSGAFGDRSALHARFDKVSLALLTVAWPALDVSGRVSGTVDMALSPGNVPTGTASLKLNNLSRAGIASASLPIDVGLNAELSAAGAIARAVIVRGGKVEGRAQARIGPVAAGDTPLKERIFASPILAQLRYNGPAQALWGLSGVEAIDVRGPVSIVADITGDVGDPKLAGTLRSEGARVESTALGAVIDQVSLASRFTNSRLDLTRFSGRVGTEGSITGSGGIDLSAERAFPMDIRLQLKNAKLVNRDDFAGSASGNVRIATDEYGGVFSGNLVIDRAVYNIGRSNIVTVPTLYVTEKNAKVLGRRVVVYAPPTRWLLNLGIKGDRRLFLSGMGVQAEWRADLKIKGGATTPEVSGRVELVRGDYDFAGKRFTLTKGDVRFQGAYPPDPRIDIAATSSANGFTAQLDIDGTAQRPEIKFSSVPALPEDEVLSRVLFGDSVTNLSAPEAVQLAGALASLRGNGGGFNPINSVRKGLGIDRLRILPADTATGRKTALAAGQYIGRNVYVELATDAQGYTATNIEVSLTRSLSILSTLQTLGGTSANLQWKKDY